MWRGFRHDTTAAPNATRCSRAACWTRSPTPNDFPMTKQMLKLVPQSPPTIDLRQVGPRSTPPRRPNKELRSREYLTPTEMDALLEAARKMRHGHRDSTMLLIAYHHGFRAAEIVDLRWEQVDLDQARLRVRRVKKGTPSIHPLQGDELRALRRLRCAQLAQSNILPPSEADRPFSAALRNGRI